jgi:hypothetical protein
MWGVVLRWYTVDAVYRLTRLIPNRLKLAR